MNKDIHRHRPIVDLTTIESEFLTRYNVNLKKLKTTADFAEAAFKIINGFYETADNIQEHLEYLFNLHKRIK